MTFISRIWWESRSIYNIALGTLSNYWSRYRTFNNDSCICFKCSQRAFPPIDCWTIEFNRYGNDNHCSKHLSSCTISQFYNHPFKYYGMWIIFSISNDISLLFWVIMLKIPWIKRLVGKVTKIRISSKIIQILPNIFQKKQMPFLTREKRWRSVEHILLG